MFVFAQSEYDAAQSRYEKECREANASNQDARAIRRKAIENELVQEGIDSVIKYESELDAKWEKAKCNNEYDGLRMGYAIVKRAKERLVTNQE